MDEKRDGILYQIAKYFTERRKTLFCGAMILLAVNFYFGFLCATHVFLSDLIYLDLLFTMIFAPMVIVDFFQWNRVKRIWREEVPGKEKELERWLGKTMCTMLEDQKVSYEQMIYEQKEEIQELTDYMTKWAHEAKLPLSALLLMNGRNEDLLLQKDMQDCLKRLDQLVNTMMMSSKLRNLENDVEIEKISLDEIVKESLKNQSYFLIQENFQIEKKVEGIFIYSDKRWLVYLLDQLLSNAVKYCTEHPILSFYAEKLSEEETVFSILDNGIGILKEEIPYVFDRGFIGSNLRDGDYRSTGMGLYFVKKMAERLGIRMEILSDLGKGTEVKLYFSDNAKFFYL